jgi:hypothetical protein
MRGANSNFVHVWCKRLQAAVQVGREGKGTVWAGSLPARARVLSRDALEAALPGWAGVFTPGTGLGSDGAARPLAGPPLHPMQPLFAAAGADAEMLTGLGAAYTEACAAHQGR